MGPLIEGGGIPDWVEVQANGVAGRNNSTRNDVVAIEQGASDGLADAVDVNRRCGDESDDEAGGSCEQCGDHQNTEPTDIKTVVGGGDPSQNCCQPLAPERCWMVVVMNTEKKVSQE